jgi:hypothetical protein
MLVGLGVGAVLGAFEVFGVFEVLGGCEDLGVCAVLGGCEDVGTFGDLVARVLWDLGVCVGGAELAVAVLGAGVTTPAGATANGPVCPWALARRLRPITTAVVTLMTVVTRRLIGVTM